MTQSALAKTLTDIRARAGNPREPESSPPARSRTTRTDLLIALLSRDDGATIAQMCGASGWLPHSVRGFMAGTLRKRHGMSVVSEKTEAGRVYRVSADGAHA